MSIIERIKNSFYQSVLRQRGTPRPKRTVINLTDARTIGIIYDSTIPDHDIVITKFAEMLRGRGKSVEISGYIDDKQIERKGDISLINPKGINWYGIPLDPRVAAFTNKPFDLLICALLTENKPLEYIAYMSNAKYRIGPFDGQKTSCYDLMIDISSRRDLSYLLQQMVHFLEKIKYD